jgi:cytochrome c biogenesis protein CcmG, thiol:disulfide interchange protein DsbE
MSLAATGRRTTSSDRIFKAVAALAGVCLVAFIAFVVARGPAHHNSPGPAALEAPPPPTLRVGTVAPPFTLPNLRGGTPVSLAAFRGTPVILNFFASWCPDCRAELAAVATIARRAGGRVAVIGVDSNDISEAAAASLLVTAHASYPVAIDAHAEVSTHYLVSALPVTYFLNADGKVAGVALGPQSVSSLDRWLRRLGGDK